MWRFCFAGEGRLHEIDKMRVTYRFKKIDEYWKDRWSSIPADEAMENLDAYPIKYAEAAIRSEKGRILEAGCGAGRILRYYKNKGNEIIGVDYIHAPLAKLKAVDPTLRLGLCDIRNLIFPDRCFRFVLAFGLYHNLEKGFRRALKETYRVLEPGGKLCASFRADNVHTRLIDLLASYRGRKENRSAAMAQFHKMNLKCRELVTIFENAGFHVKKIIPVENMPLLYKFALFRSKAHRDFDEGLGRKRGYQLSHSGRVIHRSLSALFPWQFCNIHVVIAERPKE